jgi:NAD-dependent DNA ligase
MRDPELLNSFSNDRLVCRQIDELIGLARGLCADGVLNQQEVEFLQGWLAANGGVVDNPIVSTLYRRVSTCLADGFVDVTEQAELFAALTEFSANNMEVGELLKATSLPLCDPPPTIKFDGRQFCFTGIFNFGARSECARAVEIRGGSSGSLTKRTDFLVVGVYATESWKHSSFGNKIIKAASMRDDGLPIAIVSEEHWIQHL